MVLSVSVRAMLLEDIDAVLGIQLKCYDPAKQESRDSFISKVLASPQTCFVASRGAELVGYLVSVPAEAGSPVPLNAQDYSRPSMPNALYLHDLAVDPAVRGAGVAAVLLEPYFLQVRKMGLSFGALTAVNNSCLYWRQRGFREVTPTELGIGHLSSYGPDAQYMLLRLEQST